MRLRIGIDLGGTKIEGVLMDGNGAVACTRRVATPFGDYRGTVDTIAALVATLADAAASRFGEPHGLNIGIGTPGTRSPQTGLMKNCNSTWLNGRDLLGDLRAMLGARVRLANDADCFALSEAGDGAGAGFPTVFGVILGTGVGGGFVVNGQLLQGPNGLAGEWGHTPLPYLPRAAGRNSDADNGSRAVAVEWRLEPRLCYCGRWDCIETYLSGPGLARTHAELWHEEASPEDIVSRGDGKARETFSLYCGMLARSLAQVINIVDPAVVVLGGGLSEIAALYPTVERQLPEFVFSGECVTPLVPPAWGASSGVRGAARLWAAQE